jgi:glycine/D-amino acid oxidase-like deaminating enzyme
MIQEADAVVIGSGALGSSVAFHLARAGRQVAVVEKHAIASQTSPRAAGLTAQVRGDMLMTRLAMQGVRKIERFTEETGEPMEYFQSGSMKIARLPAHVEQLREEVERGKQAGVEIDFIPIEEARRLMPFLQPSGVRAVTYTKSDLYIEPVQIPLGYARAAARLGAELIPATTATAIGQQDGRVTKVVTDKGEIRTPVVVDAAGAWTRLVASRAGLQIGAIPTRHQLMITEPLAGVDPGQPITRVIDCNVYIRPEKGGLMLGGYESDPKQYDMGALAAGWGIADLDLDLSVLRGLAERVAEQFPVFKQAAIREHRGGLPTMTADGEHVVGPVPGLDGFFVAGGCCVGGLSIAPAIGEILAELIVTGRSPIDLSMMSPARDAVQMDALGQLIEDCRASYAFHYWSAASLPGAVE